MNEQSIFVHFDSFSLLSLFSTLGRLSLVGPGPWPPLAASKNNENNENNQNERKISVRSF